MGRRPNDRARPVPPALPPIWLRRDHTSQLVRTRVDDGTWERAGRGVYVRSSPSGDSVERRLELCLARIKGLHRRLSAPIWFSHESAAVLWGLPVWTVPTVTHVLREHRGGSHRDPQVRHHSGRLDETELTTVNGLPVTSLERTIVDCATTLRPLPALIVADGGARLGADPELLGRLLASRVGHRGIPRARAVIEIADDGAESPGESATRFVVTRDGLPAPRTQIEIATHLGTFWADMGWDEWRLLLEYDGRGKYRDSPDAFVDEKRRHDAIQEAGWRSVRVTKEDLKGTTLTRRLHRFLPADVVAALRPRPDLLG